MKTKVILLLAVLFPAAAFGQSPEERAAALHARIVTIDSHNDTKVNFSRAEYSILRDNPTAQIDIPKMEAGGLDCAFFAAFTRQGKRDPETLERVKAQLLSGIRIMRRTVDLSDGRIAIATSPDEICELKAQGKRIMVLAVENGHGLGKDLGTLDKLHEMGVRCIGLCHNGDNDICDAASEGNNEHGGLSEFGRQVVRRMNDLGIIVDISHASDAATAQTIEMSAVPVVATHSCVKALCDNPRNMNDQLMKALAARGGVMQITIVTPFLRSGVKRNPQHTSALKELTNYYNALKPLSSDQYMEQRIQEAEIRKKYPQNAATVTDIVNHIDYAVKLIGIDHVGIGTDFDGGGGVDGCRDASQMKNITVELIRRGYSDQDIEKIWGGNLLRVFRQVQDYAAKKPARGK